ncbi:hypothetical protein [Flammeovirga sp. SubArs3]|uniref:hypothetical protein n=1 Tax=Flammeovirga sp. SubArs3 TaxID=2995316 RepID=UPI00248C0F5F|nr:hypothetical protein [Flammeovirga sp. SubArs3]
MKKSVFLFLFMSVIFIGCNTSAPQHDFIQEYGGTIIRNEKTPLKAMYSIRIPSQLTKNQINNIAVQLKNENLDKQNVFIEYLLPDMVLNNGAWATSHYNPTLEIKILGLTKEEEQKVKNEIVKEEVNGDVIGKWYNSMQYIEHTVLIYKEQGNLKVKLKFKSGSESVKDLKYKKVGTNSKYTYRNDFGEYYILTPNGQLSLYDNDGLITKLKKI